MKKASKSCKLIVDTNIWISFLIGKSLKGLQYYINDQSVVIISCDEQIHELTEVFSKPKINKHFTLDQIDEFFDLFLEAAEIISLKTKTDLCRDPKDNYLLSLALDANADYLITGDNDLLVLEKMGNTRIISYAEFETIVKQ
jgi:uncharacterized protein